MDDAPQVRTGSQTRQGGLTGRRFVLATMPVGPFSGRLAEAIRSRGGQVRRVLTNGGDRFNWGSVDGWRPSRGADWQAWLQDRLTAWGATDVVTMGDMDRYSAAALQAARIAGLRTHVLEQGYLRPNWVTYEPHGANANSCVPRSAEFYRNRPEPAACVTAPNIAPITVPHTIDVLAHALAALILSPAFPDFVYPNRFSFPRQLAGHTLRAARRPFQRRRYERLEQQLIDLGAPIFIAMLQREGDRQFSAHSDEIADNPALIERVVASFARHAPSGARLAVRNHPLDPAIFDLAAVTRKAALAHGVGGRVTFLDYTPLAPLLGHAAGVVTLNSTAAITAIEFGVPTKLLGHALFDIEGLVDRQPLDAFWRAPAGPDRTLFERFRAYLLEEKQVFGNFYNREHLAETTEALVEHMARSEAVQTGVGAGVARRRAGA